MVAKRTAEGKLTGLTALGENSWYGCLPHLSLKPASLQLRGKHGMLTCMHSLRTSMLLVKLRTRKAHFVPYRVVSAVPQSSLKYCACMLCNVMLACDAKLTVQG